MFTPMRRAPSRSMRVARMARPVRVLAMNQKSRPVMTMARMNMIRRMKGTMSSPNWKENSA